MWVFGYGSLIWKVDFPFETKMVGHVKGFDRKFYQHSTDHRGTLQKPGRVVTLVSSSPEAQVWGVAYKISEENVLEVVDHLDHREKGGYERRQVLFHPKCEKLESFKITIYVGTRDNLNYAGEADENSIARQIVSCAGPSGTNVEYVCKLAKAMREIAPHIDDGHLFAIEREVLHLLNMTQENDSNSDNVFL